MALLEVCCGNLASVDAAVAGGAKRIELCKDLEVDGLTPPVDWIRAVRAHHPSLILHVLIRPRAGDFVHTPEEADILVQQIEEALEAGADGIVVGGLTPSGDVDVPLMERLVATVESFRLATELLLSDLCHAANDDHFFPVPPRRIGLTFHRAFDRCRRPFEALEQIIGLGFDRILTSGQEATAEEGMKTLLALRQRARGRILILPGGGVTPTNAAHILAETGCTEIHASASESVDGVKTTSAAKVAAILAAISS